MNQTKTFKDSTFIPDNERICDYISSSEPIGQGSSKTLIEFNSKIKEIQEIGIKQGLDIGVMLLMINKTYGYTWRTIPYGKIQEIKTFISNNAKHYLAIIDPSLHEKQKSFDPFAPEHKDNMEFLAKLCPDAANNIFKFYKSKREKIQKTQNRFY